MPRSRRQCRRFADAARALSPSRQGCGAPCRRHGGLRRRRDACPGARRGGSHRRRIREPAGGQRHHGRDEARSAARLAGAQGQYRLRRRDGLEGEGRGRLRQGASCDEAQDREQPSRHELHGNARRRRELQSPLRALSPEPRQPRRARHSRRALGCGVQGAEGEGACHDRRCRRRLRHQGLLLSRIPARRRGGEALGPHGRLGRRAR